jgi:hypothetical protein
MSESGPDFSFSITTEAAPIVEASSGIELLDKPSPGMERAAVMRVPTTVVPPTTARSRNVDRRWIVGAASVVFIGLLAILIGRVLVSTPTVIVNVSQPSTPPAVPAESKPVAENKPADSDVHDDAAPTANAAATTDPSNDLSQKLAGTVYLIQLEKAGQFWPFATCVAVDESTLLTTAREAVQLAEWQKRSGLKIWITQPGMETKKELLDVRVHGVFTSLADKPGDWIYFDVGLLTVEGGLTKTIPLASPGALAELEAGLPVFCLGYMHQGDKLTRFDHLEPQLAKGKIYIITAARELPGNPRLLHVKAEIPPNAYGSAVVNAEGQLVGLYGEVATSPGDSASAMKNLHYVTMVSPTLLDEWRKNHNEKIWPAAATIEKPQPARNTDGQK